MEAPRTGAFWANSLGIVVKSALSYLWTAAGLRSQSKPFAWLTPDNLDHECDLWLHECAASSADGTFTHTKEEICTMAAPESCSPYFEGKRKPTPSNLSSYYRKQRGPMVLGGGDAGYAKLTGGASVMGKLRPSSRLSVSKLGVLLGWNTLGWVAACLVCRAVKKARTRGLREARIANNGAGGNPVGVGGNGAGEGAGMAVINEPVVADMAALGGAAGVGGFSAEDVAGVEGVQQALIPPGFLPPGGGDHDADRDPAIGDRNKCNNEPRETNKTDEPGGGSSVKPGGGSPTDRKPCSVSPGSPLSAPLCEMSPGRVCISPSKSRSPFPNVISARTKHDLPVRYMSQDNLAGKARQISGNRLSRRHSVPFAIGEGKVGQKKSGLAAQKEGAGSFGIAVAVTALATASPGLASSPKLRRASFNRAVAVTAFAPLSPGLAPPPKLRRAKLAGSSSAGQEKSKQSSWPSESSTGGFDAVTSDLIAVPAKAIAGVTRNPSSANSSGGAKSIREGRSSDNGGKSDKILALPAPVSSPAGSSPGHSAPIPSTIKASDQGSKTEDDATKTPFRNPDLSDVGKWMGAGRGSSNGVGHDMSLGTPAPYSAQAGFTSPPSTPTSSKAKALDKGNELAGIAMEDLVGNSRATNRRVRRFSEAERDLRHLIGLGSPNGSNASVSDALASDASVADRPASQAQGSNASGPSTPGFDPPGIDPPGPGLSIPGPPSSSSYSTTYSACWVVLPEGFTKSTSLHGLSDLDDGVASSAGWGGALTQYIDGGNVGSPHDGQMSSPETIDQGVEEAKGGSVQPHPTWTPPIGIDVDRLGFESFLLADSDDDRTHSDGIGSGIAEEKGTFACQLSSAGVAQEVEGHARSDRIAGGIAEEKGASACQRASSKTVRDRGTYAHLDGIGGGFVEKKGESPCQMPASKKESEVGAQERSDLHGNEAAEEKRESAHPILLTGKDVQFDVYVSSSRIERGVTDEKGAYTSPTTTSFVDRPLTLNQSAQHAPMSSGSRLPCDGNNIADCDPTIGDYNSIANRKPGGNNENNSTPDDSKGNAEPGRTSSVRRGGGSLTDGSLCSAVSVVPPLSVTLWEVSPRCVTPCPSNSLPPFPQDTRVDSPVRSGSQKDIGGKEREMSGRGPRLRYSSPVTIGETKPEKETRGSAAQEGGPGSFDHAVDVPVSAALSPCLASPPMLRSAELARSTSVAQAKLSNKSSAPLNSRGKDKDAVTSESVALSVKTNEGVGGKPSPASSFGGLNSTGQSQGLSNGGSRDTSLAIPAPAHRPAGLSFGPCAPTSSKAKALGEDSRLENDATGAVTTSKTIDCRVKRFSETEQELRITISRGSTKGLEAGSARSSAPISDAPTSGAPVSDRAASQARAFDVSGYDSLGSEPPGLVSFPSTSLSSSSAYSAFSVGLPEGFTTPTSRHGLHDRDVGVASSEGWGGAFTKPIDGSDGVPPHGGNSSSHDILDRGVEESKGGSSEQPRSSSTPPIGIEVDRRGYDSFLFAESDDGQSRSDGIGGGVAEEKWPPSRQMPSVEMERAAEAHARSDHIRLGSIDEEAESIYYMSSAETERDLEICVRSNGTGGGFIEESRTFTPQISSTENERGLEAQARSGRIRDGVTEEKRVSADQMLLADAERELTPHACSRHIERGATEDTEAFPCPMSSAEINDDVNHRYSLANSTGGAKRTGSQRTLDKSGDRHPSLTLPAPASPPNGSRPAAFAPICSEANASCEGCRRQHGVTEDSSSSSRATNHQGIRSTDAERELRATLPLEFPNVSLPAIPPVAGPEVSSTHSSAAASDAAASEASVADGLAPQARASGALVPNAPAPDTTGPDASAPEEYPPPSYSSLRSVSDLGVGVASSASSGGAATLDTHGGNGGSPHEGSMSCHDIPDQRVEEMEGGSVEPRTSRTPPIGMSDGRLGFDSFLHVDSDDGHSRSDGIGRVFSEEKGASVYQISPAANRRELDAHERSGGIGGGAAEWKGSPPYQMSSCQKAVEIEAHARSDDIGTGVDEEKGWTARQVSPVRTQGELESHARSDSIRGDVIGEKGGPPDQMSFAEDAREVEAGIRPGGIGSGVDEEKGWTARQMSPTEKVQELDTNARSDRVRDGALGESGASTHQMSSAEKERELKIVLGLITVSPNAHPTIESEGPPSLTSPCEPRWGNMSTTVPLEERQRRNQELFDAVQRRRETGTEDEWREAQPAPFPEESTWPSGGNLSELEGPADRLPPPSDYEVQEVARMLAIRDEVMREFGLEI